ncbi:MAG: protein kinase [Myxococcota bacterium]
MPETAEGLSADQVRARMEQARQEAPKVQFGSYVLHDRIGAGGMAEIFLATAPTDQGVDKELVIKRILPSLSGDEQFVKMFVEEARLCVNLRHPNIVQVYDLGEVEAQFFIAMEYVHGRDLLKTLAACAKKRMGFPTDIALYIVMEVLKGLDYAHNLRGADGSPLGIIHRDVSPSNVLLSFDGKVKLGDFGIAKASTRERTATGILKGKFGYMAPEQVIGRPIDHRADVFAVGILLYELLTGHRLFAGRNDLAVLERVRDAVVDPPPRFYNPELSRDLEGIVLRALSRDANDRFQSTSELHEALYNYTFKRGVVVTSRTLSRFLHELFLTEETEEHYGATAAKEKARASMAAPEAPRRSLPPRPATSRERPRLDLMTAEGPLETDEGGTFGDESTDSPEHFDDDPTTQHKSQAPEMLPFPGAERAKASFRIEDVEEGVDEEIEEGSGQTDILDFPSGRPLLDPAEPSEELDRAASTAPVPAARRVALEPVEERRPGSEVRALRKQKAENSETELNLEDQRPVEPVEEVSAFTPYGGVPVMSVSTPETSLPTDGGATVDGEDEAPGAGLVEAVRRAMDPTEPVESTDGEAERTDLLDQVMVSQVIAEPAIASPSSTARARALDEELEEAVDFVELAPEATSADQGNAGKTAAETRSPDWVEHTRDERTAGEIEALSDPMTTEGPAQRPFGETSTAPAVDRQVSGTTAGADEWKAEHSVLRADALLATGLVEKPSLEDLPPSGLVPNGDTEFEPVPSVVAREWNAILEGSEKNTIETDHVGEVSLVTDSIAHPDALEGATENIPLKQAPAPLPVIADDIPSVRPRKGSGPKAKLGSSAQKPVEVKAPLSVVGRKPSLKGKDEETRMGLLAPSDLDDPDAVSADETRMGALARTSSDPKVVPPPGGRRMSSGVTAALSEAALADQEIQEMRALSVSGGDHTSLGYMVQDGARPLEPLDEEAEETVNGPRPEDEPSAKKKVPRVSESFGRLEDSGASGLFGALKLLDEDPADLGGEMRSFSPDEEASLDTTAGHTSQDFEPRRDPVVRSTHEMAPPSVLRTSQEMMVAPSVAAAMKNKVSARGPEQTGVGAAPAPDFRDPAEEPSGIVLNFEKFEEPTDSVKEPAPSPDRSRGVRILEGDEDSISSAAESPDIVSERPDLRPASVPLERRPSVSRPPIRAPSLALSGAEHFSEETPHSLKFAQQSADGSASELENELRSVLNGTGNAKAKDPASIPDRGIYGREAPELMADELEFGPDGPASGKNPAAARPSGAPKADRARGSSPPKSDTDSEAERRMRAMVERMRPAKEKQRTAERPAERGSVDPHANAPTGPVPRPSAIPEPARASVTPQAARPTVPPQIAAGPVPSSRVAEVQVASAQGISLHTALMVLFFALVLVALAIVTVALTRNNHSNKPIPPVNGAQPIPVAPKEDPIPPVPAEKVAAPAEAPVAKPPVAEAPRPEAEPVREAVKEPVREAAKEPVREAAKEPVREAVKEPVREAVKEPVREAVKEPAPKETPRPVVHHERPAAPKAEIVKAAAKAEIKDPEPRAKEPVKEPKEAPAEKKTTRPEPKAKLPPNLGALKINCSEPATVTIIPGGSNTEVTTREFRMAPGIYRVIIKRADGSTAQSSSRVIGGESQTIACDH